MTLGDRVLDWLLRRLHRQKSIESDLVLVREHDAIADASATFSFNSAPWHFAAVRGELTLREALLRGGRLVVAVPERLRLPLDLVDRAYLRRLITIEARDIVAAVAGSSCGRLQSAALADAILRQPRLLAERGSAWTFTGQVVTEAEVKQVLVAAELGFDRKLERLPADELLRKWIVTEPPVPTLPELVEGVLRAAHGQVGGWLAWAARERRIDALITAGALAGSPKARALAPRVPGVEDERAWEALRALVEAAVRRAWDDSPSAVNARLEAPERLVHTAGIGAAEAARHPLLRGALEAALFEHAHAAAEGRPLPEAALAPLGRSLHATPPPHEGLELARELARVARFCDVADQRAPGPDASMKEWAFFARDHTAWADLAARAARRWGEHAPADVAAPRRRVLDRYLHVRDALNQRFAAALARDEVAAYRNATLPEPLPLHLVTRALIRPLVEAGHRVFLLVLDGCDLSSFYDLLRSRRDVNAGLCLPVVSGQLAADLEQTGCLHVGLSPLPTVTSHARRALFAGDLPKNPVLDETEAEAANARADVAAWARNHALRDVPRRLMLKGDLGPDGANVVEALEEGGERVLAAVFNGIDDALSSHETTAMGPWAYGDLGHGLRAVLNAAARGGWVIVVTSDHGHTPFWSTDRKAAARSDSQRYGASPLPGSVAFPGASMRPAPLHLLTAVGAYAGNQRRGFHGGAGLEEVIVPIAVLGNATVPETRPKEPDWWAHAPEEVEAPTPAHRAAATPAAAAAPATSAPVAAAPPGPVVIASLLPVDYRAAFSDQPRQLKVLELLAEKGVLTSVQVGKVLDKKPSLAHGFIKDMEFRFHRLRLVVPFTVEEQQSEMVYRWKIRS